MTDTTVPWKPLAARLANVLADDGVLTDPGWRAAFENVPRHVFVPQASLEEAYADDVIVTQHKTASVEGGGTVELATSSASAPFAVAVMLDRLDLRPGMKVLEVGTGTGYNAALLSYRVGDDNTYSVELDPQLTASAHEALKVAGFAPTLTSGDGYQGMAQAAPFDRIIATCAIDHVPPAWIRQMAEGGRIVAPLMGGGDAGLLILDKTAPDEVNGRFDPHMVGFMPLRDEIDNPLPTRSPWGYATEPMPAYGTSTLDPAVIRDADPDLLLWLHLHIPGLRVGGMETEGVHTVMLSRPGAHAQAHVEPATPGRWPVTQQGSSRLWDTAEHAVRVWELLGKPTRDRLGVSALDDVERQYIWLDDPDGPYSWPMPI